MFTTGRARPGTGLTGLAIAVVLALGFGAPVSSSSAPESTAPQSTASQSNASEAASAATGSAATEATEPESEILLTVEVITEATGTTRTREVTRAELEALPQDEFTTSTIWTEDVDTYSGPRLLTVMDALELPTDTAEFFAANEYSVNFDFSELHTDGALLALLKNGAPMSLREKGPLWVIYNYDSHPKFRTEAIYAHSIWQLNRIVIRE